ncbi:hypothetical protein [Algoriphagus aquimarinus]|uniref:tRNA (Guanine-N1)-methyltransferase n=1 Tax=Algoriphagus aquimarinus TaxID=237018 RepID=A0A1I0VFP9_9BACT|nr:hypothetical protein [Algoriphagus aquimarinus]SFA74853.1 hypothetical protein SAMN04489723_101159 [Algoriphagus aquimarinus]|tara:strand:+ start:416612 stop:417211 length:600 start_codon:yes stop_codon:yes gene_type:complete
MKRVLPLFLITISLFAIPFFTFAQTETTEEGSLDSGTIDSQFEYIYSVSNNFQEYKVVKRTNLDQLKSNILDSMRTMRSEVGDLKGLIVSEKDSIKNLKSILVTAETEKQEAISEKDNFSFLGMGIHKAVYSSFMWILVAVLASALAIFSFQYFSSFKKIRKAQKDLAEVQEEFDNHRKNMLDRERKLKRELVDAQLGR